MTQEELKGFIRELNEDVANTDVPKIIESVMDLYQKGIEAGMKIGREIVTCSVIEYLKSHSYVGTSGQLICNFTIEELKKAIKL